MKLVSNHFSQELAEEGEVGDRPEVAEVIRVETRLFEDGGDRGSFEAGGYIARFQGLIDDVNHEVQEGAA